MKNSLRIIFGQNVHRLRVEAGIDKSRFALMVGISRQYLLKIETGKANVTIEIIEQIAEGLTVPPEDLLS